jgi:hypothetical protein
VIIGIIASKNWANLSQLFSRYALDLVANLEIKSIRNFGLSYILLQGYNSIFPLKSFQGSTTSVVFFLPKPLLHASSICTLDDSVTDTVLVAPVLELLILVRPER